MDSKITLEKENPHEGANIVSKVLLWCCFRLFRQGHKFGLTLEDVWKTRKIDKSDSLGDRLEKEWMKEVNKANNNNTRPSLSKAIVSCFWFEYMLYGFSIGLLFVFIWPMIPYTLALFIQYFSEERSPEAYKYAHVHNLFLNICICLTPMFLNHTEFYLGCTGMRVRIASCSLLYRKILKLNRIGLNKTETGQIINLMSNDVSRFDIAALYLHYIWIMPIVIILISYLVWQSIAWATFAGIGVIFLQTLVVQTYLSNLQAKLRGKIAKRTDERVKVMSELVSGVQVIKMYAWEKPFEKLVDKLRKYEIKFISQTSMIKGFSTALMVFTERLILFAAIITFVFTGGEIRSGIAFSLVQYYNLLQLACNIYFPWALAFLGESKVSVKRLEDFLLLDELKTEQPGIKEANGVHDTKIHNNYEESKGQFALIELQGITASWHPNPIVHTLRNITLKITSGKFTGIAGSVGSGKSSLLQVILGELQPSEGKIYLGDAKISYASQEPWLFVGSVRQNILFGLPYDKTRYNQVVAACALLRDFDQLPTGDLTLVGERGISLSGGQRARIGLARACYREADIYLLDDPLSAVDTHVGKHLLSECVMGLLRHSTRVLVTHQLHHLKSADTIVLMQNGEIENQGTFKEISQTPFFAQILSLGENQEKEEKEKNVVPNIPEQIHDTTNVGEKEVEQEEEPEETDELMGKGRVPSSVYIRYFRAGSGWIILICTVISILFAQVVTSAGDLMFTNWMNKVEANYAMEQNINQSISSNSTPLILTVDGIARPTTTTEPPTTATVEQNLTIIGTMVKTSLILGGINVENPFDQMFYIYLWGAALIGCIIFTTLRSLLFMWVCMRSSIKLHNKMFSNILTATMRFFDTNPSGRILNRFSKDMGTIDEIFPKMFVENIQIIMVMCGILTMVAIVNPYMILTTVVCGVVMYFWTNLYLTTAQIIKRLEGVSRSPVFSHVSASLAGLTTIRACDAQQMLCNQFDDKQDVHTATWYLVLLTNASFCIWLSLIAAVYVFFISYTFLLLDNGTTKSGNVGLALSQGIILVNMLQYGIKQVTQVITQMTSVERILEYTNLPQEVKNKPLPPKTWPQEANIIFKDLYLRYDKDGEPVLRKLNVVIESGWKVGVVGRTGAGKSSLISALFRLAPIDGHVYIDNVDTGDIALEALRSRISIIPQEPVLFSASLRYNLDPFDKYSDADVWKALEQVELKDLVTSLSSTVESGGSNFSAGQRQLLCLARAVLASNRLLVLDEATANVDSNTDALIQKSIRKYFSECTVVTVAHRLHTVADADRIIVMEEGRVIEFGHPHELLQRDGAFTSMVKELGSTSEHSLRELASAAYLVNKDKSQDKNENVI